MRKVAIIGSGPAGLFCADRLAGLADVTIFEKGHRMGDRRCVGGCTCQICDVLEGAGGAGGFSDGKNTYSLTRGTQMETIFKKYGGLGLEPLSYIDGLIVRFAGEGVWYDPLDKSPKEFDESLLRFDSYSLRHVGSDGIRKFVTGMTEDLESRGVEIKYGFAAYPIIDMGNMAVNAVSLGHRSIQYDTTVIAAGLQGIPWIEASMIRSGSPLHSGPAGFGIRLEARADILKPLHDLFYDYKLILDDDRASVRSFCCNQMGYVLNERHTDLGIINVNGHSFLDPVRHSESSNLSLMLKVSDVKPSPQDVVRSVGKYICGIAGGHSACQSLIEFMGGKATFDYRKNVQTNRDSVPIDIAGCLPPLFLDRFRRFIWELDQIVPVVNTKSVIYAPEIKYYGRRVNVSPDWKSNDIRDLYIVGSGSGYMDSFVAAALSGIVAAENIKKEVL